MISGFFFPPFSSSHDRHGTVTAALARPKEEDRRALSKRIVIRKHVRLVTRADSRLTLGDAAFEHVRPISIDLQQLVASWELNPPRANPFFVFRRLFRWTRLRSSRSRWSRPRRVLRKRGNDGTENKRKVCVRLLSCGTMRMSKLGDVWKYVKFVYHILSQIVYENDGVWNFVIDVWIRCLNIAKELCQCRNALKIRKSWRWVFRLCNLWVE